MNRLDLSPLPCTRPDGVSCMPVAERDGFVDDSVVLALVAGSLMPRQLADSRGLTLPADDMDFAGWRLSASLPAQATGGASMPRQTAVRRAAPPTLEESGLGAPHCGSHRWWLAGLAGALSTLLFSTLLLSLSWRENPATEGLSIIGFPAKPAPPPKEDSSQAAPELTGVSTVE